MNKTLRKSEDTPRWRKLLGFLLRLVVMVFCARLVVAFLQAFFALPVRLKDSTAFGPVIYGTIGLALGLIVFSLVSPFMPLYVFGHELTHWLIAKLFRRDTGKFTFSARQGSVEVKDPNVWIILGPYFIPIYLLLWVFICAVIRLCCHPAWLMSLFCFGLGLSYAFHCVLTLKVLRRTQQDLRHYGKIFSFLLIIAVNLAIIYFALAGFSGKLIESFGLLLKAFGDQTRFLGDLLQGRR